MPDAVAETLAGGDTPSPAAASTPASTTPARDRDAGLAETVAPGDAPVTGLAETVASGPGGSDGGVSGAPDAVLATLAVGDADVPTAGPPSSGVRRRADDLPTLPTVPRDVYRIDGELGRGGMGRVLRARDRRVGRAVAIKEVLGGGGALAMRFEREAMITARLQHPAIVPVYECGRWPDGEPFYAMKLVAGRPLDAVVAGAADFAARAALLPHVIAVCEALAYAHDRGVVHRDLKPANVLCGDYGETVVIDWGLAKDLSVEGADARTTVPDDADPIGTGATDVTHHGSAIGTPAYMPPEQARGEPVDARADVYALGALLYHVLAGAPPYHGLRGASDVLEHLLTGRAPAPVADRAPEAPAELAAIVARAMQPEPAARYPSARELAEDLRRFQAGQVVSAHRYTLGELVRRWLRRHRTAVITAAALLTALAVVAVISVRQVVHARDLAQAQRAAVLEEQGRQELVAGSPARALPYLIEAWRAGRRTPSLRIMLGEAMRHVDDVEAVIATDATIALIDALPDGRVLIATTDGGLRLAAADGSLGPVLGPLDEPAQAIALGRDGATAAAVLNGRCTFWDPRDGHEVGHVDGELYGVRAGAGPWLVTLANDEVRAYRVDAGALAAGAVIGDVSDAALIDRGGRAALATVPATAGPGHDGGERLVELRDPATGELIAEVTGAGPFDAVRLVDGGRWVLASTTRAPGGADASADADPYTRILAIELATDRRLELRLFGPAPEAAVATSDGGLVLAYANAFVTFDGRGELLEIHTGDGGDDLAALTIDGRPTLASRDAAGVRLIDVATGRVIDTLDGHAGAVMVLAAVGDGARLITGGDDQRLVRWRPSPRLVAGLRGHPGAGDATSLLVADDVRLQQLGDATRTLTGHRGPIAEITLAGDQAITVGTDHTVRRWRLADGTELGRVAVDALHAAYAPGPGRLAAIDGATVHVWRDDGTEVATLDAGGVLDAAAWSPDGATLAMWASGEPVLLWRDGDAAPRPRAGAGPTATAAFSPDGATLAIGGPDGTLALHGLATGAAHVELRGHGDAITSLAFSPDGRRLLSGSRDGTARLWDVARGRAVAVLDHGGWVTGVAVRADGRLLATTGTPAAARGDGVVRGGAVAPVTRVWDAATGAPLWSRDGDGQPAFVPQGLIVAGDGGALRWRLDEETRPIAALAAAQTRAGRWRLDGGVLIATVGVHREVSGPGQAFFDFADDVVEGSVPRPELTPSLTAAGAADADDALRALAAAWLLVDAGQLRDAGVAAAPIDGARLPRADQRYALAFLRRYAGDTADALRWMRDAATRAPADHRAPYLRALAELLVVNGTAADAAIAELRAAAAAGTPPLRELERAYLDAGRDGDAAIVLDAVAAAEPTWARLERARLERDADRPEREAEALRAALGAAATADERADVRHDAIDAARLLHRTFADTRDRRYGAAARELYDALLAQPDLGDDRAALELDRGELAYALIAGDTHLAGRISKDQLRRVFRRHLGAIQRCYEDGLLGDPALTGRITLRIQVDGLGKVVHADGGADAPALGGVAACAAARARAWRFVRNPDYASLGVSWPVMLRPAR
ncbi:MAG: protein kinase [Kofleriaceae bacterium]|nr:protein kinase [Kofleriaceae bacterium]